MVGWLFHLFRDFFRLSLSLPFNLSMYVSVFYSYICSYSFVAVICTFISKIAQLELNSVKCTATKFKWHTTKKRRIHVCVNAFHKMFSKATKRSDYIRNKRDEFIWIVIMRFIVDFAKFNVWWRQWFFIVLHNERVFSAATMMTIWGLGGDDISEHGNETSIVITIRIRFCDNDLSLRLTFCAAKYYNSINAFDSIVTISTK